MAFRKCSTSALVLLFLVACRRGEGRADAFFHSAKSGLRVSAALLEASKAQEPPLPAARASLRAGVLLTKVPEGAGIPPPLEGGVVPRGGEVAADAELLARFIELLHMDIQAVLSEAQDRSATLDEYVESLETHLQRGEIRLRALEGREEELQDDERRLERRIGDLRDELDNAVRGGEATGISALVSDLTDRQGALAAVQTELVVVVRLRESLEEVLEPVQERLRAIQANREALIKGVRVIDIPGVEDLGIIVEEGGRLRVQRGRRR